MADGSVMLLAIAGLAIPIALLTRCGATGRAVAETWYRHEVRNAYSGMCDRLVARALHDPDWQWHWEARERQMESLGLTATERLCAQIGKASGDRQGATMPTQSSAKRPMPPKKPGDRERTAPIGGSKKPKGEQSARIS